MTIAQPRTPETEPPPPRTEAQDQPGACPRVVFLVHGTFAGKPAPPGTPREDLPWWDEDSRWADSLRNKIRTATAGSDAEIRSFQWPDPKNGDGPNLESQRLESGERLLDHLLKFEQEDGRPYHLIGHSHGGSVIWHALVASIRRERSEKSPRLRRMQAWVTVGTPFIEFRGNRSDAWGPGLAVLLAGLCFLAAIGFLYRSGLQSLLTSAEFSQLWWHAAEATPYKNAPENDWWMEAFWGGQYNRVISLLPKLLVYGVAFAILARLISEIISAALNRWQIAVTEDGTLRRLTATLTALLGTLLLRFATTGGVESPYGLTNQRAWLVLNGLALVGLLLALLVLAWKAGQLRAYGRAAEQRRHHEKAAADEYGAGWLGFSHPDDEAIALMSAAMLETPELRPPQKQGDGHKQRFSVISRLDHVVRPLFDEATWRTLVQFALGDDQAGLYAARVGRAPSVLADKARLLNETDARKLSDIANDKAVDVIEGLRGNLRHTMAAQDKAEFLGLLNRVSFSGVLHCSYLPAGGEPENDGPDILDTLVQWIRTREGSAADRSGAALPPLIRERDLDKNERMAAPGRFARLEFATIMVWGLAGLTLAAVPLTLMRSFLLPLTQATQLEQTLRATRQDPHIFNMEDAALAGSYAVYLAAAGELNSAAAIGRIMTEVTSANTRAIIAQRLAFAFGVADKPELASAVLRFTTQRDTPKDENAHRQRANFAAQLSLLYARAVTGKPVDAATVVTIGAAMDQKRQGRPPVNCSDTDLPGILALRVPVMLAANIPLKDVRDVLTAAAEEVKTRCTPPENRDFFDSRAWIALRLVEMAGDLASWGRQDDLMPKVLKLAGAGTAEGIPLAEMKSALTLQERHDALICIRSVARIGTRLKDEKQSQDQETKSSAKGGSTVADTLCDSNMTKIISQSHSQCRNKNTINASNDKENKSCENFSTIFNDFEFKDDVSFIGLGAYCRAYPVFANGEYRSMVSAARKACNAVGRASGAALSLAKVLTRMKDPPKDIGTLLERPSSPDTTRGSLQLFELPEAVRHLRKALPYPGTRLPMLQAIRAPLERAIDALENHTREEVDFFAKRQKRALFDAARERLETLAALRIRLLGHVAPVEAAAMLHARLEKHRQHPDQPLTLPQARSLAEAISDVAATTDEKEGKKQPLFTHAMAARIIETAIGIAPEDGEMVLPKTFRPATGDEDIGKLHAIITHRIEMQEKLGVAQGSLRSVHRLLKSQEDGDSKEEFRLAMVPLRARTHLAEGNYAEALRAARETARRDQQASIHCAILEIRARSLEKVRKDFHLTDGLHWPKPVPTLFDTAPSFTFDNLRRGLPRCTLSTTPDND